MSASTTNRVRRYRYQDLAITGLRGGLLIVLGAWLPDLVDSPTLAGGARCLVVVVAILATFAVGQRLAAGRRHAGLIVWTPPRDQIDRPRPASWRSNLDGARRYATECFPQHAAIQRELPDDPSEWREAFRAIRMRLATILDSDTDLGLDFSSPELIVLGPWPVAWTLGHEFTHWQKANVYQRHTGDRPGYFLAIRCNRANRGVPYTSVRTIVQSELVAVEGNGPHAAVILDLATAPVLPDARLALPSLGVGEALVVTKLFEGQLKDEELPFTTMAREVVAEIETYADERKAKGGEIFVFASMVVSVAFAAGVWLHDRRFRLMHWRPDTRTYEEAHLL